MPITYHMAERIDDLLLTFDCVSGPLIESDRDFLYTSVRDLPLSGTIQNEMWGCSLCGLYVVVYKDRRLLIGSINLHWIEAYILCCLCWW